MIDPKKAFMQASGLEIPVFPANSRYAGLETTTWTRADGRIVSFTKRRFIPKPENFATLQEHMVQENDRLDNLAAEYFSDPELYWRLCDANGAMRPEELTSTIGSKLRITLPEGMPEPEEET